MCEPSTSGTDGGRRGGEKRALLLEGKEEKKRQAGRGKMNGEAEGGEETMGVPVSTEVVLKRESSAAEEGEKEEEEHREGTSEAPSSAIEPVSPGQQLYGALYMYELIQVTST